MIPQLSGYIFVDGVDKDADHPHGDLDRILVNGEIMTRRTGDTDRKDKDGNAIPRANILRGEDVIFAAECINAREFLSRPGSGAPTTFFTHRLSKTQMTDICTHFNRLFDNKRLVHPDGLFYNVYFTQNRSFEDVYSYLFWGNRQEAHPVPVPSAYVREPLRKSTILSLVTGPQTYFRQAWLQSWLDGVDVYPRWSLMAPATASSYTRDSHGIGGADPPSPYPFTPGQWPILIRGYECLAGDGGGGRWWGYARSAFLSTMSWGGTAVRFEWGPILPRIIKSVTPIFTFDVSSYYRNEQGETVVNRGGQAYLVGEKMSGAPTALNMMASISGKIARLRSENQMLEREPTGSPTGHEFSSSYSIRWTGMELIVDIADSHTLA